MGSKWWKDGVIYQIYPKSFKDSNGDGIGDLKGVEEKLPYLKELGIDGIWLSPVYLSPQIDNGYDISDYYQIDPMFGNNQDMERLIQAAHRLDIKIIMDFVANHTSDQCEWFQKSRQSKNNPYSDYYIWQDPKPDGSAPNNWGSNFGGSAWTFDPIRQQYYLHYYAKEQPDLNWENPKVRQSIYDMMRYWQAKGVDGFRMDVITSISKDWGFNDNPQPYTTVNQQNGPRMHEFIHEMNKEVLAPLNLMSVGEAPAATASDAHLLVDPNREELDMIFTFEHMHIDRKKGDINGRWALQAPDFVALKRIMSEWQSELAEQGWNALYFENHDRARIISRWGNDTTYRYESATVFATLLHGMKGTPYIYQGEEIGMTNPKFNLDEYVDIELRGNHQYFVKEQKSISEEEFLKAVHKVSRDNARTPMQWDDSKQAGFTTGTPWLSVNPNYRSINVVKDRQATKSIFNYYQQLIHLRHTEPILKEGSYELLLPDHPAVFAYKRQDQQKTWLVIGNLSEEEQDISSILPDQSQFIIQNQVRSDLQAPLQPYESFILEVISEKV
ncbi:glycoside hydrolase family 13 protein [Vagococcus humatus]|uniref:Glucohydrolase n=1 Tax=Vagococcus humatus TaxID=1889241 RepID=A0A3R9YF07_9ENTE|nr:alpha-glucosidase [Vagococcus humatus]RST89702.1 glucohydrolase [Vagococcus humatus]